MPTPNENSKVARTELEKLAATLRFDEMIQLIALGRKLIERRDTGSERPVIASPQASRPEEGMPPAALSAPLEGPKDASDHAEAELARTAAYSQRLDLVNELNLELGAVHDLGLVYNVTAKYMRFIFPQIGRASIALCVPSGDSLQVFALDGVSGSIPAGTLLPLEGTLIGTAVKERRVVLAVAPRPDEHLLLDMKQIGKMGFCAALAAPLISGGEVIGTLNTAAERGEDYTSQDEHLLTQAAATLAVNIERWRLVEKLNNSLIKLQEANQALQTELDERIRANQVIADRERTIEEQHRELLAMSTPLIPITERVVVMPLIGVLSVQRVRQVFETALQGVHSRQAKVVILDITGLEQVNSDIASMLVRMAKALRLLGCRTILTGIRPEVAQMLVRLETDFAELATHGTLQSAVAVALATDHETSHRRSR